MKKTLSVILAILLIFSAMPLAAVPIFSSASTIVDSGKCGEDLTWTLDDDGTLTISGTGDMYSYFGDDATSAPWGRSAARAERVRRVIIDEGVTSIGREAFSGCSNLESIVMPDSLTRIEEVSFVSCPNLSDISFGNGLECIYAEAFEGCSGLTNLNLPNSVTFIENMAFYRCTGLTSVTIPGSLAKIESELFGECTGLTNVVISNGVTSIGASAFGGCTNLTSITIPDSVIGIEGRAFSGCTSLTSITIPDSVTDIGGGAFCECTGLDGIELPDSLSNIPGELFYGCTGLSSITIPDGVTSIGRSAFADCSSLSSIMIPDSVTSIGYGFGSNSAWYDSQPNGLVYAGKVAYKYKGNIPANTSIVLDEGTLGIAEEAFYNSTGLTSITIPNSVEVIGDYAFNKCTNLSDIEIPDSVISIGKNAFNDTAWFSSQPDGVIYAGKIAYQYKGEMQDNTEIILHDGTTGISDYAFENCDKLSSITIPSTVKYIGDYTFSNCSDLTAVMIPDSVTSIGDRAFNGSGIESISLGSGLMHIGRSVFDSCNALSAITMVNDSSIYHVSGNCLIETESKTMIAGCKTSLIPADGSVTSIGTSAFYNCNGLLSITIPDSVISIGSWAFGECDNLASVTIPNSVTSIGERAFYECDGLLSITIPESVMNIGPWAFSGCDNLASVTIPNSWTNVWFYIFEGCFGLSSITFPDTIKSIKEGAFKWCTNLVELVIPDNIISIAPLSFSCCENLTEVVIGNGVTCIGADMFGLCTNLKCVITSRYMEYVGYAFEDCTSMEAIYFYNRNCIIAPDSLPTSTTVYGYTGSTSETYADEFGLRFVPLDDHEHSFTITKEVLPTCTETGYRNLACVCGERVTETIDVLGHDWSEWTDSGDGENNQRECARCHETETTAHVWNEGIETKAPTCMEDGSAQLTCTLCGVTKTVVIQIDPDNHADYGTHLENAAEATCTEAGYTGDTVCNGCGAVLISGTQIGAHGHNYQKNEEKSLAPDYGAEGYDYYECAYDANHFYRVIIPALVKNTYTVTFTADGEVVAVVPYTEGDKFVEEPPIPEKDNCTAEWAEYTLNDTNITVAAVYTPIDLNDISDIETQKTVDGFENGVASITLSASAATRAVRFTTSTKKPVDVILVLDLSGSMDETLGAGVTTTKMEALKACAIEFIEKINCAGGDNRIALVGFASGDQKYNTSRWENTGLIVTGSTGFVSYPNAAAYYGSALMPTGGITGVDSRIIDAINALEPNGATCTHIGLLMAKNILAQNGADGREKVVVLITDGTPTIGTVSKAEINQAAPIAVTYANDIKNMGVKLYTVGVEASANENAVFTSASDGVTVSGGTTTFDFNRFLNIVSTNYPNAVAMNSYGAKENNGYYMGVNDTSNLDEIFSKIIYSSVDRPVAFTKCNLIDTLSSDFTFTLEQEYAFRDALSREYNITDANISVTRNADGTTTIRVNGVPAVKKEVNGRTVYVASVTFEASLNRYESGNYATNTENAFVEINGEQIASFPVPEAVTIPANRNIVVFKINGEVYRIEEGSLGDEITAPATALAGWSIPEGTVITGNYAEFEATDIVTDMYTVTWNINGETVTETYAFGSQINIPAVADQGELVFAGFSPAVPHIMPARNMTFTAVFAPKHNHQFKEVGYYGTCTEGLTIVSKCACGETSEAQQPASAHRFTTVVGSCVGNTLTDTLVCSVCGASEQHTMTFQMVTSSRGKTTVLDLSLEKNGTVIQPAAGSTIKIMIPWTNQGYTNTNVKVTRVNEQGVQKTYTATIENGYLVFYADHFSIYLIEELDGQGNEMEPVSYQCAVCELNGTHDYESTVTAPTCTENGYTTHICPACGDSYTDSQTNPLGHTYAIRVTPPTCTTEGFTTYTCTRCRDSYTKNPTAPVDHVDNNHDGYCDFGCGTRIQTQQPDEPQSNCVCGQYHTGPMAGIIKFFHQIVYFFKNLFNR